MQKKTLGDYLAWIVLALIVLWLILKVTGVINTPLLVEYSPLFGAVYLAGYMVHKLRRATEDIRELKEGVKSLETTVITIDKEIQGLKENMHGEK